MTLFTDIWNSVLIMPAWVKAWVFLILIPINVASLHYIGQPGSALVVSLAVAGLVFNAIPMWFDRGFSTAMAIPHVIFWVPLIVVLIYYLAVSDILLSSDYRYFLMTLMACNLFSLCFDIPDSIRWFRDRNQVS